MLRNVFRVGAAFLMTAGIAAAQQPVPVASQPPVRIEAQPGAAAIPTFRAKQILGSKILIQGNTAVGTVDDLIFDNAGNLEYIVVANDGKLVTVPFDAAKFDLKSQSAVLNITPDVYKTIPTYTGTTYPDYWAPAYRTQVYKYYGVTPRDLRRIERRIP